MAEKEEPEMIHLKNLFEMKKKTQFQEHFEEYTKTWARLREPHLRDMLTQLIKLWNKIEEMWATIDQIDDPKEWMNRMKILLKAIGSWNLLLTRMGLTYTAQPYLTKEERVKTAKEMIEINGKLKEFGKQVEAHVKKRLNKGGRRTWKEGTPIQMKKKEKKKDGK